jgi:hypothetical protein
MTAPQQEARQREEHRDSKGRSGEQSAHQTAAVPGLEGVVQ